jgi:hypothetical protein
MAWWSCIEILKPETILTYYEVGFLVSHLMSFPRLVPTVLSENIIFNVYLNIELKNNQVDCHRCQGSKYKPPVNGSGHISEMANENNLTCQVICIKKINIFIHVHTWVRQFWQFKNRNGRPLHSHRHSCLSSAVKCFKYSCITLIKLYRISGSLQ